MSAIIELHTSRATFDEGEWTSTDPDTAEALNVTLPEGGFSASERCPSQAAVDLAKAEFGDLVKVITLTPDVDEGESGVEFDEEDMS